MTMSDRTDNNEPSDYEVLTAITDAAEAAGMRVDPAFTPTPEMRQAAADRLEVAETAIRDASGAVPPVRLPFNPTSRQRQQRWSSRHDDPLWLLTPAEFGWLPDGTTLVSIRGERVVKGHDYIDQDTRGGWLGYGLLESQIILEGEKNG